MPDVDSGADKLSAALPEAVAEVQVVSDPAADLAAFAADLAQADDAEIVRQAWHHPDQIRAIAASHGKATARKPATK